jgi:rfaE bifunctional protein kinase chain/domain
MSEELLQAARRLAGARALVVGDVMLDEYVWGEVTRISPEAPVPIVDLRGRSQAAGGAANTAAGIAALGGVAVLVGLVGDDGAGRDLAERLAAAGVAARLVSGRRPTTVKTRIIAHSQQVVRIDAEQREALDARLESELIEALGEEVGGADAVVISDYAKGLVSPDLAQAAIRLAQQARVPVVADPKGADFAKYRGATVVTPNLSEVELASGVRVERRADVDEAARRLRAELGGSALLITRGGDGMSLYENGEPLDIPATARNVFDVTGAGDAVVAVLALALAAGLALGTGARLANAAGGVVVGKVGTAGVSPEELEQAIAGAAAKEA